MKPLPCKLIRPLLTRITLFVVLLLSISPIVMRLNLFSNFGAGFVSNTKLVGKLMSEISGPTGLQPTRMRDNFMSPDKNFKFWNIGSFADIRASLEFESYRYLHHPDILNQTYDVWKSQFLRASALKRTCDGLPNHDKRKALEPPSHLLVDDANKFIFCEVRKVSSITWRRVLDAVSSPNVSRAERSSLRRLGTYPAPQRESRLRDYTKFMFVREPMLRLVSGWRDKFVVGPQSRDYQSSWGLRIKNHSNIQSGNHGHVGNDRLASAQISTVSFVQFVRYLTNRRLISPLLRDMHWEPYYSRCSPCLVRYDFVGHYETLRPDAAAVLGLISHRAKGRRVLEFPDGSSNTVTIARQEFPKLSPVDVSRLSKIYDLDYRLFGYSMERFLKWLHPNTT